MNVFFSLIELHIFCRFNPNLQGIFALLLDLIRLDRVWRNLRVFLFNFMKLNRTLPSYTVSHLISLSLLGDLRDFLKIWFREAASAWIGWFSPSLIGRFSSFAYGMNTNEDGVGQAMAATEPWPWSTRTTSTRPEPRSKTEAVLII